MNCVFCLLVRSSLQSRQGIPTIKHDVYNFAQEVVDDITRVAAAFDGVDSAPMAPLDRMTNSLSDPFICGGKLV